MDANRGANRDAVTLHCSSCGAPFPAKATVCLHCRAEITLEERKLDALCTTCGARMSSSARFCMRCGLPAAVQPTAPLAADAKCPRCKRALRERATGGEIENVVECSSCGGLWIAPEALDRLCASTEAMQEVTVQLMARKLPPRPVDFGVVAYLRCPSCSDMMVRRNFGPGSGVVVDVCRDHGVWLDHTELERVLHYVREGGLVRARQKELERLKRESQEARDQRWSGSLSDRPIPVSRDLEFGLGDLLGGLLEMFTKRRR